eukprot:12610499-Alexandrium_andersonii.AAC.1
MNSVFSFIIHQGSFSSHYSESQTGPRWLAVAFELPGGSGSPELIPSPLFGCFAGVIPFCARSAFASCRWMLGLCRGSTCLLYTSPSPRD